MVPEVQEETESEESVRWLSYILDNDETESGNYSEIQKDLFSTSLNLNRIRGGGGGPTYQQACRLEGPKKV